MGRKDLLEHMHTKHQLCGICTLDWWPWWYVISGWLKDMLVGTFKFFFSKTPMFFHVFFHFPSLHNLHRGDDTDDVGSLFLWSARKTEKSWTLLFWLRFTVGEHPWNPNWWPIGFLHQLYHMTIPEFTNWMIFEWYTTIGYSWLQQDNT